MLAEKVFTNYKSSFLRQHIAYQSHTPGVLSLRLAITNTNKTIFRFLWPCIVSKLWREKNQKDATIRRLLLTSISTCFGNHYAHLQKNKEPVSAFGVLFWFCWMWLVTVVGRCLAGCEHYEEDDVFPIRFTGIYTRKNTHNHKVSLNTIQHLLWTSNPIADYHSNAETTFL